MKNLNERIESKLISVKGLLLVPILTFATHANGSTYNFTHVIDANNTITGSFTGNAQGNLITGLSNFNISWNGEAFDNNGQMSVFHQQSPVNTIDSLVFGGAYASFDGAQNNFGVINLYNQLNRNFTNEYSFLTDRSIKNYTDIDVMKFDPNDIYDEDRSDINNAYRYSSWSVSLAPVQTDSPLYISPIDSVQIRASVDGSIAEYIYNPDVSHYDYVKVDLPSNSNVTELKIFSSNDVYQLPGGLPSGDWSTCISSNIYNKCKTFYIDSNAEPTSPVTLTFSYDQDFFNGLQPGQTLHVWHYNESTKRWEDLGGNVDKTNRIVTIETTSLSPFMLMPTEQPKQPNTNNIPEPNSITLLAAGILGFSYSRKRNKA